MAGGVRAGDYILAERDLFEISQDAGEPLIILFTCLSYYQVIAVITCEQISCIMQVRSRNDLA
jgi:hypothetical protein